MSFYFLLSIPVFVLIINTLLILNFKKKQTRVTPVIPEGKYIKQYMDSVTKQVNILVVEDDVVNRKLLETHLTKVGFKITTVNDGSGALQEINSNTVYDLVILDIVLPDFSGFTVCSEIRQRFTMYELPVIMVTAKNRIEDLIKGFEVGANDFVVKPYNMIELLARTKSTLSLKSVVEHNTSLTRVNKLKSDLIDMAAHDLKSPLTLISGYAKMINDRVENNKSIENYSTKIIDSSTRMLEIISKLLQESQDDDLTINPVELNIVDTLSKCISLFSQEAKNKKQNLRFINKKNVIRILVDEVNFKCIIENLLSNAIKYSPMGSDIIISISDDPSKAILKISDNGPGFTEEELNNLFNRYYPISNKPTNGENSTGLGLSIVKKLVETNRGYIEVDSTPGIGTTFSITFSKK